MCYSSAFICDVFACIEIRCAINAKDADVWISMSTGNTTLVLQRALNSIAPFERIDTSLRHVLLQNQPLTVVLNVGKTDNNSKHEILNTIKQVHRSIDIIRFNLVAISLHKDKHDKTVGDLLHMTYSWTHILQIRLRVCVYSKVHLRMHCNFTSYFVIGMISGISRKNI